MSIWPFQRSKADQDAERLLEAVTEVSRRPAFFGEAHVPDTLEGRFEFMTLNAVLALVRLQAAPGARPLAQAFTDKLFHSFDSGLREAGTGDTAVPKRMTKLAGAFYGRLVAYERALDNVEALAQALSRNLWGEDNHHFAGVLAGYAIGAHEAQARAPVAALFDGEGWPHLSQGAV